MNIISRASWGARPPRSRITGDRVTMTYLHHTASAHSGAAGVRAIQNFHLDNRGWADIAYNFVIDPHDLRVYEGRGWGVRPGSQKSFNAGTWSVCVMGNFETRQPTQGLLDVTANLIRFGHQLGHIPLVLTGGHKDAPNQSTACPGRNLHRRIPDIRNLLKEVNMTPSQEAKLDQVLALVNSTPSRVLSAEFGGPAGSANRRSLALHVLDIKSLIGALDSEGVSEAELDQRVSHLIAVLPDRILTRLRDRLG